MNQVISEQKTEEIYNAYCIDGEPIEKFVASDEFVALKHYNLDSSVAGNIKDTMKDNQEILLDELRETTQCKNPKVIPIPVIFRSGHFRVPDLVNGAVNTPPGEASQVLLPRTYFAPFDDYVKSELQKYGVSSTFVHDLGYHLRSGEVHCGTNTASICKPE